MVSAATVTIDAGVLAVPSENGTQEAAYQYVETILDWAKLMDEPWVAVRMSERASSVLFEEDLYPLRDQLKQLFAAKGVVEYDANTVTTVVDRLVQLTPSFEAFFSIRDVLTENLTLEPDILEVCSGVGLRSELERCVVMIAILRVHSPQDASDYSLILRSAEGSTVQVRAQIHDLDHSRQDLNALPTYPEYFEGEVLVCEDFAGLIECLNETAILLRANDNFGVETAIRAALYKARVTNHQKAKWDDVQSIRVGPRFHELLQSIHPTEELVAKVLRAIVETVECKKLADTHALRTGSGGGDPPRMRGNDRAMRRDIDYEYHLHYWQCADGTVEIASVVVHNDFSIPE